MTAESGESEEDEDSSNEFMLKIEEVGLVKTKNKQLFAKLEFMNTNSSFKTDLDCQLDTGATCNVISHRDVAIID